MEIHQLERAVVLLMAQLKAWLLREIRSISKRHGGLYIYICCMAQDTPPDRS